MDVPSLGLCHHRWDIDVSQPEEPRGVMDILDRQAALPVEADAAVVDLELAAELASFGEPVRVGSSAMGLMSKPDVDLTVICPKLDGGVTQVVAQLGRT